MEQIVYYTFSTIPQVLGAIIALLGVFIAFPNYLFIEVLFILDRLHRISECTSDRLETYCKESYGKSNNK